ncbi:glycosyltransferase family 25 protein [Trematosphaeria pertusa]|uniref:Glycosyltransferase family 25 protein n=1 Tax=Trematosphaeria pertusa TaxID=390896 RepID=A0A6A6IBQ2_9PLEO|nr:glycosyltransferase family 25 protein [Trematosphaeria pertusa]KAF2247995.1 glycosyltransferase family 25 protein [Trematosphaeria pertusa]
MGSVEFMLPPLSRRAQQLLLATAVLLLVCFFSLRVGTAIPISQNHTAFEAEVEHDLLDDIYNTTLGFGQILVINLPERTDRRDAISLAAAYSNMRLDWIHGVKGSEVHDSTLPMDKGQDPPSEGTKGSWRAHLNAVQAVIDQNLTTGLIMEDDMDWDIRIRDQLRDFAKSARALLQPLASDPSTYADPSFPTPKPDVGVTNIHFDALPETVPPTSFPYGDDWDVLWIGHCGMAVPTAGTNSHGKGRVVHENDATVPVRSKVSTENGPATLTTEYADHTRLVHHVHVPVCSTTYAVSQQGARRILYELSVNKYTSTFDNMLRELCDSERDLKLTCLTAQPSLFKHWRPRGSRKSESDISDHREEWRDVANIRWSVRLNMPKLLRGEAEGWVDQYPN